VTAPIPAHPKIASDPFPHQEATMGQAIPNQHPAVVLRSHYRQLRALLAIALVVVIGLTVAVVILATDDDQAGTAPQAAALGQLHYGGFNPSTGRPVTGSAGGPEESAVAAAVGTAPSSSGPDESATAAAVSGH
jgi:hypothetical protein